MAMEFTYTSQEAAINGVKILCYAPPGYGKTSLVATLPNPVLISAESGLLSLSRGNIQKMFGVNTPGITYDIPVIKIKTADDLEEAYRWCSESEEAEQYDTVAVDSISEIMDEILKTAKAAVTDKRQAYGLLAENGENVIKQFRDLHGKHVYMSAKMGPFRDEVSGITKYGIIMPGKMLGPSIPFAFDEVYALRIGEDEQGTYRYVQTQPDLQYDAKCRSGALEPTELPNMGDIIRKIEAHMQGIADAEMHA